MSQWVGITDLRTRIKDVVEDLPFEPTAILRHGRPVAFLIGEEWFGATLGLIEDLEDEVAILRNRLDLIVQYAAHYPDGALVEM